MQNTLDNPPSSYAQPNQILTVHIFIPLFIFFFFQFHLRIVIPTSLIFCRRDLLTTKLTVTKMSTTGQ